jgi:hypothetical protein
MNIRNPRIGAGVVGLGFVQKPHTQRRPFDYAQGQRVRHPKEEKPKSTGGSLGYWDGVPGNWGGWHPGEAGKPGLQGNAGESPSKIQRTGQSPCYWGAGWQDGNACTTGGLRGILWDAYTDQDWQV